MSPNLENPAVGYRTRQGHSSFQFTRRAVLENVQTTRQFYSLPILVRLKSFKVGFINT